MNVLWIEMIVYGKFSFCRRFFYVSNQNEFRKKSNMKISRIEKKH